MIAIFYQSHIYWGHSAAQNAVQFLDTAIHHCFIALYITDRRGDSEGLGKMALERSNQQISVFNV